MATETIWGGGEVAEWPKVPQLCAQLTREGWMIHSVFPDHEKSNLIGGGGQQVFRVLALKIVETPDKKAAIDV